MNDPVLPLTAPRTEVLVVGSINLDLVVTAARLPLPGETVLGTRFEQIPGGKGANQAVAAARLGAHTRMLGCLGNDAYGIRLRQSLQSHQIDDRAVTTLADMTSGLAVISVDQQGQNSIIVLSGANGQLTPDRVRQHAAVFAEVQVVLLQLEIPLETVSQSIELARHAGALTVLDPAPVPTDGRLPEALYRVDLFTPNHTEAERLWGQQIDGPSTALAAAAEFQRRGSRHVVIKLGPDGAVFRCDDGQTGHVPAPVVSVVDTTAAGDAFNAALACGIASGQSLATAMSWGCCAGSVACTRHGAQPSLPNWDDLRALFRAER
jgi:ribokinase